MPSRPSSRFEQLLSATREAGASWREDGVRVRFVARADEMVTFYVLDDESRRGISRELLGLGEGDRQCDCAIHLKARGADTLCLVELKGSKIDQAAAQLCDTAAALKRFIQTCDDAPDCCRSIAWKHLIRIHHASPGSKLSNDSVRRIRAEFGERPRVSRAEDASVKIRGG